MVSEPKDSSCLPLSIHPSSRFCACRKPLKAFKLSTRRRKLESNPQPFCWEAAVLAATSPCSLHVFHSSISYILLLLILCSGLRGVACPSYLNQRWRTPWTSLQFITGPTQNTQHKIFALSSMGNLGLPLNLTCMSLDCGYANLSWNGTHNLLRAKFD